MEVLDGMLVILNSNFQMSSVPRSLESSKKEIVFIVLLILILVYLASWLTCMKYVVYVKSWYSWFCVTSIMWVSWALFPIKGVSVLNMYISNPGICVGSRRSSTFPCFYDTQSDVTGPPKRSTH